MDKLLTGFCFSFTIFPLDRENDDGVGMYTGPVAPPPLPMGAGGEGVSGYNPNYYHYNNYNNYY